MWFYTDNVPKQLKVLDEINACMGFMSSNSLSGISNQTITKWKVHLVQADRPIKSGELWADILTLQELPESINFSINKMTVNR